MAHDGTGFLKVLSNYNLLRIVVGQLVNIHWGLLVIGQCHGTIIIDTIS